MPRPKAFTVYYGAQEVFRSFNEKEAMAFFHGMSQGLAINEAAHRPVSLRKDAIL